MSGEKVAKTDKATEIWYRLLLDEDFKKDANKLKKRFLKLGPSPEYYFRQHFLLEKYGALPSQKLRNLFDKYVLGKIHKELGDHFTVRLQTPSGDELRLNKRALIKLWIYDGVSRDEIINYIKKNWRIIRIILRQQNTPKIKRLRKIENKKQTELVLKYHKLSTSKLRRLTGEHVKGFYRELLIGRLLKKDGYPMSFEAIKGVITRFKYKRGSN